MSAGGQDDTAGGLVEGVPQRAEQTAAPTGDASELLTFLIADIRGYTKFTQQRGDEAAAKLTAKFATIVRDLVAQFGGTVFELRGDEALCVFASPRQSLRLAIALQQRFVEETVADVNLPMAVGIGIDVGEAVRGADGYRGGALNLAARLCGQAKPGEVLASLEVTHLAQTISGIRFVVLDSVALKGLSDTVQPVRVLPDGADPARQIAALLTTASPAAAPAARPMRPVRWLPGPLATRPRMTLAVVAAVAVLVAGGIVLASEPGGGGASLRALNENSLGVVDPGNGHLVGQVGLDAGPTAAAAGFDSIWTANTDANTVSRVDPSSRKVSRRINVGAAPSAIAIGLNSVWVANSGSATVSRINPATAEAQTIAVGADPGGIAVAGGSVWVANSGDGTVSRIDPSQGKVVESIIVGEGPSGISAGRDIWVANSAANTVSKIDGRSHAVTQTVTVGNGPKGVAVVGDSVWVTNNLDDTVARIATTGTSVAETVRVGPQPTQIAAVGAHLWVASQASEAIAEIDPASARVIRTVRVGAIPGGMAAARGKLWVTTSIHPGLHRGGTIHLLVTDETFIDPIYEPTANLWNGTYDALVGYRQATGADATVLVPDLVTAIPNPSNGGRTYTFQLRPGIRWSTGQPLTVFDVRRGLQRTLATGYTTLNQQILGASGCRPSRCDVAGITVDPAAGSVTITLVRPSAAFLDNLTAGLAAPAATPLTEQKARPIPATGPYQIARYVPGKLIVLTRNRFFHEWSAAAQPAGFPDRIEWNLDPDGNETRAVNDVAAGTTDWADASEAAKLGALRAHFGRQLYVTPSEAMMGVSLNTRIPPFNDERVRRALALAIDRTAIAADWARPASVTCQFLPQGYPGYRAYCPYTLRPDGTGTWFGPDFPKALALVRASHTLDIPVTVWVPPDRAASYRHVVSALTELGYRARLVVDRRPRAIYFNYVQDSRNRVQASYFGFSGGGVNAANSLAPWGCKAFVPASPDNQNPAQFCDPSIDGLARQADAAQAASPGAANGLWAQVDGRLVDAEPWIPLVNSDWVDVVSARVHNYKRSAVVGVLFDQMWVR